MVLQLRTLIKIQGQVRQSCLQMLALQLSQALDVLSIGQLCDLIFLPDCTANECCCAGTVSRLCQVAMLHARTQDCSMQLACYA